ncbi:MAG: alkaline phosphatase family protein [Acetobacteraceae bacterium]|nr:alkaline phosphatase family protein [Acetobacteraceae bacterium]
MLPVRVVLIGFDGLRPDLVSPARTPHLARLAAEGAWFSAARSVFPSETRAATPSLATGCRPGAHGMVANTLFDAALCPGRLLRTKSPADLALLAAGGESPLERETAAEVLARAGRSFALVSSGTAGAARLLHPAAERLGQFRWNVEEQEAPEARRLAARFGPVPPAAVPNAARIAHAGRLFVEHVLAELRPDVALLWLSEPDLSFHYAGLGAAAALAALAAADAVLGRVMAWREAEVDAAEIVIGVLSDHGHVTGRGKLSLVEELRRAGFDAGSDAGRQVVVAPGAAPGLWLRRPEDAPALAAFLAAHPWTGALLPRDPALLPEGWGIPLSALGSAHRRSADLVLCFAGDAGPDVWGLPGTAPFDSPDVPEGGGMHGGLHAAELASVLVFAGGPIRRGAVVRQPADLSDVMPTVLHLFGLAGPQMEGRPLLGALAAAEDAEPEPVWLPLPRGFLLEGMRNGAGRFYPSALRRA